MAQRSLGRVTLSSRSWNSWVCWSSWWTRRSRSHWISCSKLIRGYVVVLDDIQLVIGALLFFYLRTFRWLHLQTDQFLPINWREERVLLDGWPSLCTQSFLWITFKQSSDEGFSIFTHIFWKFELSLLYVLVESGYIIGEVWWLADQELIEHCAYTIQVWLLACSFLAEHFWWKIGGAATEAFGLIVIGLLAQSKISQFDMPVGIKENILRL